MSSDIYFKQDISRKIGFTNKKPEEKTECEEREVNIYESADDVGDYYMVSLPQGEDQQVHSPPADNKSPARSAKLGKMLLWILMLGVIFTLAIYLPLEIIRMKKSINHLQAKLLDVEANNTQLKFKLLGKWCPDGWTTFGSNCYCKYKGAQSWSDSRKHCQDRGADLAIIDSPEEQEFVKELDEHGESWIGLKHTLIEATRTYEWRWVDGSPQTQTFWAAGLARNPSYETNATCCNSEGKWTYPYYNDYKSWICEK